jgi:serine/threonine-protein kinase
VSETTRIGTVLAGYRIESLLGRGGMSVVYLAEHMRLGRKVALKVLAAPLAQDAGFRERFVRESQRAAELDHPNVIPIYDAGEVEGGDADGLLYIAMRYVQGSDLRSLLREEGKLSVGRTLFVLEQAAGALDAAHDRGLIHRDVKPANILIAQPSEHVYLTDFGVAKQTTAPDLTRTGMFIGTIDYAAPEQIEGLPLNGRTDVYALGCVLYECLAGRPPFDREAEVAVMHAHLTTPPPKLSDARPDLPKTLDRVVSSAMAKSMNERYATCPELVEAAREALLQRSTSTGPVAHALDEPEPPPVEPVPAAVVAQEAAPDAPVDRDVEAPAVAAAAAPEAAAVTKSAVRRSPPRWLAVALLVVGAAALSAVIAYVVASGGSEATPGGGSGSLTSGDSGLPSNQLPSLATLVPTPLWKECAVENVPRSGAVETAVCAQSGDTSTVNSPDSWEISIYPTADALEKAYVTQRQAAGVTREGGRCDGTHWDGSGPWLHPQDKPGGARFCYFDGDDAVLVWTHERLGQPNHRDLLAVAREGGTDHAGLFVWWRFWHHRIGKTQT